MNVVCVKGSNALWRVPFEGARPRCVRVVGAIKRHPDVPIGIRSRSPDSGRFGEHEAIASR